MSDALADEDEYYDSSESEEEEESDEAVERAMFKIRSELNMSMEIAIHHSSRAEMVPSPSGTKKASLLDVIQAVIEKYKSNDVREAVMYGNVMRAPFQSRDFSAVSPIYHPLLMYLVKSKNIRFVEDESLGALLMLTGDSVFTAGNSWTPWLAQRLLAFPDALRVVFTEIGASVLFQNSSWKKEDSFMSHLVAGAFESPRTARNFIDTTSVLVGRSPKETARSGFLVVVIRQFADAYAPTYIPNPRTRGSLFTSARAQQILSPSEVQDWLISVARAVVKYRNGVLSLVKQGVSPSEIPRLSSSESYHPRKKSAGIRYDGLPILYEAARLGSMKLFKYLLYSALTKREVAASPTRGVDLATYIENILGTVPAMKNPTRASPRLPYDAMLLFLEQRTIDA